MNKLVVCWSLAVVLVGGVGELPSVWGQPGDAAASSAQAQAEFDQRFADYKNAIRTIEELRGEYQAADRAGREQINQRLGDEIAAAGEQLDAMIAAAANLYRAAPNADPEITSLLVAVAKHYAAGVEAPGPGGAINGGDSYEQALPLIKLLSDGGVDEKLLPVWGFVSAFVTNDYDSAQAYLQQAKDGGSFADPSSVKDAADQGVMRLALQYSTALDQYRQWWDTERAIRAAEAEADDLPRVKFTTSKGEIVLELFENEAPQAVANFVTLVKQGFYDGVIFHRVLPQFMAQGGDPQGTGAGGPGHSIRCECYAANYRRHFRGSFSMAHAGRNTGGSQFFLTFIPTTHLDGKHTVFGRVTDGFDVLGKLQKVSPGDSGAAGASPPDRILKAEVLRDRGHAYAFDKLPAR